VGFGDFGEQFRSDRRRDRLCFLEEAVASREREILDGVQPFEQGSPRPSEVAGGVRAGDRSRAAARMEASAFSACRRASSQRSSCMGVV